MNNPFLTLKLSQETKDTIAELDALHKHSPDRFNLIVGIAISRGLPLPPSGSDQQLALSSVQLDINKAVNVMIAVILFDMTLLEKLVEALYIGRIRSAEGGYILNHGEFGIVAMLGIGDNIDSVTATQLVKFTSSDIAFINRTFSAISVLKGLG